MKPKPQVSIVIPLFNEQEVFNSLINRLDLVVKNCSFSCEIVLVDDGSSDKTSDLMEEIALKDNKYHCVFLSKNHGHQIALTSGLQAAIGSEAIFVIDGDLQDPPELITEFYKKLKEGFDVIYAIRKKRKESIFKKLAYYIFYRILDNISNIKIPLDSGDFGMMSRRVVNILNDMPERSRYVRGMRAWVGFKQTGLEYERSTRLEGESKYSFKMLLKLAKEGVYNFSDFPIVLISRLGIISFILSFSYLLIVIIKRIFFGDVPEGFTALLLTITMFSGVILISLGVLGEYILRIYFQSLGRPIYIIEKEIINKEIIHN
jgi:glycosyltransferase involved in cell wall biosynthesis